MPQNQTPTKPTPSQLLRECNDWNEFHPIGTRVEYYPVLGRDQFTICRTDGLAYILGDHSAVIRLRGRAGCFALANLKAIAEEHAL